MTEKEKYLFGPVPSRRLGLSLGVDIVPFKRCSLNCVYCQLGETDQTTVERKEYVAIEPVLAELKKKLADGLEADFITLSGSGEPTLNSRLGELIEEIKKITTIPVAVITNGSLLFRADVRADCAKADLVVPSLDAADQAVFERINRPNPDISIEKLVSGLVEFRKEYAGVIWLEIFMVEGVNTTNEHIEKFKNIIKKIHPDKIQLNTAVRPTAVSALEKVSAEKMQKIAEQIGENCCVVADYSAATRGKHLERAAEDVLAMLKRRPCCLDDICSGLSIHRNEAIKYITHFKKTGVIDCQDKNGTTFFSAK
jgi:wyosine [tRNA(Phe)-imidazoG37] synthetase (radical SAM superfamily)